MRRHAVLVVCHSLSCAFRQVVIWCIVDWKIQERVVGTLSWLEEFSLKTQWSCRMRHFKNYLAHLQSGEDYTCFKLPPQAENGRV